MGFLRFLISLLCITTLAFSTEPGAEDAPWPATLAGAGAGEGSLSHVLLHAVAGCASAALQEVDCGVGAAAGAAGAIYAGQQEAPERSAFASDEAYDAAYEQWRTGVMAGASAVGTATGVLLSGGDKHTATVASNLTTSSVQNNYLTHAEEIERSKVMQQCQQNGNKSACNRFEALDKLDQTRDVRLAQCVGDYSPACTALRRHLTLTTAEYIELAHDTDAYDQNFGYALERKETLFQFTTYTDVNDEFDLSDMVDQDLKSDLASAVLSHGYSDATKAGVNSFAAADVQYLAAEAGSGSLIRMPSGIKLSPRALEQMDTGLAVLDELGLGGGFAGTSNVTGTGERGPDAAAGANNAANGSKLNSQLISEEVANGHGYQKHVLDSGEFSDLNVSSRQDYQDFVEGIVSSANTDVRYATDGTVYYLDHETKTVVIRGQRGEATAFRPDYGPDGVGWDNYVGSQVPSQRNSGLNNPAYDPFIPYNQQYGQPADHSRY